MIFTAFMIILVLVTITGCNQPTVSQSGMGLKLTSDNNYKEYKILNTGKSENLDYLTYSLTNYAPITITPDNMVIILSGFDSSFVSFNDDSTYVGSTTKLVGKGTGYEKFTVADDLPAAVFDQKNNKYLPSTTPLYFLPISYPVNNQNQRSYSFNLVTEMCYQYQTNVTGSLCLSTNPNNQDSNVCSFGSYTTGSQSQYPIQVNSISTTRLTGGFLVSVVVGNKGTGDPITSFDECGQSDMNKVNKVNSISMVIYTGKGTIKGDCQPKNYPLGLNDNGLGVFNCNFVNQGLFSNTGANSVIQFPYKITMKYVYDTSTSRDITLDYYS